MTEKRTLKSKKIEDKKLLKYKQQIKNSQRLMLKKMSTKARQIILKIIDQGQFLQYIPFRGIGICETWEGIYNDNPYEWYKKQIFDKQIQINPYDLLNMIIAVQLFEKQLSSDQALQFYQQMQKKNKNKCEILVGQGHCLYYDDYFVQALQYYKQAYQIKKLQKIVESIAWIQGYWFQLKEKTIRNINKLLQQNQQNIYALYILAECSKKQQKQDIFKKILNINKQYYRIYVIYSFSCCNSYEQKLVQIKKCLQINPNYPYALGALSLIVLRSEDNIQKSKQIAEQALQKHPDYDFLYLVLSQIQQKATNQQSAMHWIHKLLQINERNLDGLRTMAHLCKSIGEYSNAIQWYNKYFQRNPYDYDQMNYLGLVYDDIGQNQLAIQWYEKGLAINPRYFQLLSNLALSYQNKQQFEKALQLYIKAYQQKQQPGVCYGASICYFNLQNKQDALKWANLCIQKGCDPDNQVYQFMGDIYMKYKQYQKSLSWYLVHISKVNKLNTDYILQEFTSWNAKEQLKTILKKIARGDMNTYFQNSLVVLQIAKLSTLLQNYIQGYNIYKYLRTKSNLGRIVQRQILKYFGTDQRAQQNIARGVFCQYKRIQFYQSIRQFQQKFRKMFNMKNQ